MKAKMKRILKGAKERVLELILKVVILVHLKSQLKAINLLTLKKIHMPVLQFQVDYQVMKLLLVQKNQLLLKNLLLLHPRLHLALKNPNPLKTLLQKAIRNWHLSLRLVLINQLLLKQKYQHLNQNLKNQLLLKLKYQHQFHLNQNLKNRLLLKNLFLKLNYQPLILSQKNQFLL